jgi:hypothetical protein
VRAVSLGWFELDAPILRSVDPLAALLAVAAGVTLIAFRMPVFAVIGVAAALGVSFKAAGL